MNAAVLYRNAFACLPEGDLGAYSRCLGRAEPEIDSFVERGCASLEGLHRAARCTECDWGTAADVMATVADFSGARCLAMLAMIRAEGSFHRGEDRAGLDDLAAVMALGRHIGQGLYMSGLAGFPIADLGVTKAFEVFGRLDSETRHALAERLDSLPAFPKLADALRAEETYFRGTFRDKFAAFDEGDLSHSVYETFGLPAPTTENCGMIGCALASDDPAERLLLASGGTRAGLLALADQVLCAFDTLVEIANESEQTVSEKLSALRDAAARNPLVADVLQSFEMVRPIWQRYRERFDSLRSLAAAEQRSTQWPLADHP